MWGGGRGEVKVVSVETHGQSDASWLAATLHSYPDVPMPLHLYVHGGKIDNENIGTTQNLLFFIALIES